MNITLKKFLGTSAFAALGATGFMIAGCETGYNSWTPRQPERQPILTECNSAPDNCSAHRGGGHDANGNGHGTK